ncbi:STAS domain-containing protein [Francisella frigiditurris]|uniref:STAS domain protein n=1 Tax=Francisella frigiditurris TaxID=1542390 RepID=A0A1J0KR42_9GAMM|nr:STAS domain-containing protein [Francisella frigiditurris]APC96215.1 STAS domain protein [Francisella frigiditurris]
MINIINDVWHIETNLTLDTVALINKKYKKALLRLKKDWTIDFEKSKDIDCSGLSLIIEYIKYAKNHNINLRLEKLNSKALSLAEVHGIDDIIKEFIN